MLSTDTLCVGVRKQLIRPVDIPNGLGRSNLVVGLDLSNDKLGYNLALNRGWNIIFEQLPQRRVQRFVLIHLNHPKVDESVEAFRKDLLEDTITRDVVFHIHEEQWEVGLVRGVKLYATKLETVTSDLLSRINKEHKEYTA